MKLALAVKSLLLKAIYRTIKRLLLLLLASIALPNVVNAGKVDAEIKGLGLGRRFKEASSLFNIRTTLVGHFSIDISINFNLSLKKLI